MSQLRHKFMTICSVPGNYSILIITQINYSTLIIAPDELFIITYHDLLELDYWGWFQKDSDGIGSLLQPIAVTTTKPSSRLASLPLGLAVWSRSNGLNRRELHLSGIGWFVGYI